MILLLGLCIGSGLLARYLYREEITTNRYLSAFESHSDMFFLYLQLFDDPFISSEKWKGRLPLFDYADRCLIAAHADVGLKDQKIFNLGEAVRKQIDDLSCMGSLI